MKYLEEESRYMLERQTIRQKFGERIRSQRHIMGISQEVLAFKCGLHRTYVGSIERGERNVSIENIFVLAISLSCEPSTLIPPLKETGKNQRCD